MNAAAAHVYLRRAPRSPTAPQCEPEEPPAPKNAQPLANERLGA